MAVTHGAREFAQRRHVSRVTSNIRRSGQGVFVRHREGGAKGGVADLRQRSRMVLNQQIIRGLNVNSR